MPFPFKITGYSPLKILVSSNGISISIYHTNYWTKKQKIVYFNFNFQLIQWINYLKDLKHVLVQEKNEKYQDENISKSHHFSLYLCNNHYGESQRNRRKTIIFNKILTHIKLKKKTRTKNGGNLILS